MKDVKFMQSSVIANKILKKIAVINECKGKLWLSNGFIEKEFESDNCQFNRFEYADKTYSTIKFDNCDKYFIIYD